MKIVIVLFRRNHMPPFICHASDRDWQEAEDSRERSCEEYEITFSVPSCDANESSYVSRHDARLAF